MEVFERSFEDNIVYIHELLEHNRMTRFRSEFLTMHSYDQAQLFKAFEEADRQKVYEYLSPSELAHVLDSDEFEHELTNLYFQEMNNAYAAGVLGEMYADNAVDILNGLEDRERVAYFMHLMKPDSAREISQLINYIDETAGAIMTTEFVAVQENITVGEAYMSLKDAAVQAETIYYVYVVDENGCLTGVSSLRDLIVKEANQLMRDIMYKRVISVQVNDNQAEVAQMVKDYDLLALPVVGFDKELLGIITVDDILDVMDEEATSDYSGLAAVDVDSKPLTPLAAAKTRLPWLIGLLLLGLVTVFVANQFQTLLERSGFIAAFMILIMGTAGNAGTQSLAVSIWQIGLKNEETSVLKTLGFELITGLVSGIVAGGISLLAVGLWQQNFLLGTVIGVAMGLAILVSNFLGALVPNLVTKIGLDPAVASGPFISTLSDLTSVILYLILANHFISWWL